MLKSDFHINKQYFVLTTQKNIQNNVYFLTESGCFPVSGFKYKGGRDCHNFEKIEKILSLVKFSKIVFTGNLDSYIIRNQNYIEFDNELYPLTSVIGAERLKIELSRLLTLLKKYSREVYYIYPTPKGDKYDYEFLGKLRLMDNDINYIKYEKPKYTEFKKLMSPLLKSENITVINPVSFLCDEYCSPFIMEIG